MAYFAKLEDNIVVQVISISNDICGEPTLTFPETESAGRAFIANTLKFDGVWKQTSFNNNFRKQFCAPGYTYQADADVFVAPEPYPSWTLDENFDWQPPTPKPPYDGIQRIWNEAELVWVVL